MNSVHLYFSITSFGRFQHLNSYWADGAIALSFQAQIDEPGQDHQPIAEFSPNTRNAPEECLEKVLSRREFVLRDQQSSLPLTEQLF